jgi:predicted DNA-binding transcriptional regulator YafY
MHRQTEVKRLLKFIITASSNTRYKANELAERLGVERTTIYRYKDLLTAEGELLYQTINNAAS